MWVKVEVPEDFDATMIGEHRVFAPEYTPVLDHGHIALVDFMGSDQDIVDAARVSYGRGTKKTSTTRTLIRYLKRHSHTSPFEMVQLKWHVKLPIFVARQWIRHRTGCLAGDVQLDFVNSESTRYPVTIKKFHDNWHRLSTRRARGKLKPSYTERLEEGKSYTVPEMAELVERRPEDIRQLINRGDTEVSQEKKKEWSEWADKTFEIRGVPVIINRERLKNMKLRFYNEKTDQIEITNVRDVWSNGVKPVYRISTEQATIRLTLDHLCLTDRGWLPLGEFVDPDTGCASAKIARNRPAAVSNECVSISSSKETWKDILDTDGVYQVSDHGRVRSNKSGEWKEMQESTMQVGYRCVNIQYPMDGQRTRLIHQLVLETFQRPRVGLEECRHLNGNPSDNRTDNLKWGTPKENGEDRVLHGMSTKNRVVFDEIVKIEYDGEEEVYDLEVETPFHNFIANGFVVHNSFNEYSARYSKLDSEFYLPRRENAMPQAVTNKQGRMENELTENDYEAVVEAMQLSFEDAFKTYMYLLGPETTKDADGVEYQTRPRAPDSIENRAVVWKEAAVNACYEMQRRAKERGEEIEINDEAIDAKIKEYYAANHLYMTGDDYPGLARELARCVIPVAVYTQWYWSVSLHNLMHFMKLRSDSHAQWEIRVYSNIMRKILTEMFPISMEAFEEYQMGAVQLSKTEKSAIRDYIDMNGGMSTILQNLRGSNVSEREIVEFQKNFS